MEFLRVSKEPCLDACAKRRLEQKLENRRRIHYDRADSRSPRMMAAAGVFKVTRRRL